MHICIAKLCSPTGRAYYESGAGNGRLTNYILNSAGECQESGRDQGHTQLGLFNLAQVIDI